MHAQSPSDRDAPAILRLGREPDEIIQRRLGFVCQSLPTGQSGGWVVGIPGAGLPGARGERIHSGATLNRQKPLPHSIDLYGISIER
ncbi:hypothetical protein MAUB1S_02078 [Mycolicibacterium aubagnense]